MAKNETWSEKINRKTTKKQHIIDVAAGRNAGVTMWAVPYGYNGGRPIAEAGPDRVVSGLPDIVRALREEHCPNPSYTNPQEKHPCP